MTYQSHLNEKKLKVVKHRKSLATIVQGPEFAPEEVENCAPEQRVAVTDLTAAFLSKQRSPFTHVDVDDKGKTPKLSSAQ